jgi:tetratricopeptide (TPR) repeat protein
MKAAVSAFLLAFALAAISGEADLDALEREVEEKLGELFQRTVAAAQLYDASGDRQRAAQYYEQARRIRGDDIYILQQLTRLYTAGKDNARLLDVYEALVRQQPTSITWLRHLGSCYFQAGKPQEAEGVWRRILDIHPDRASALRYLAPIYAQHKLYDKALTAYREALALKPEDQNIRLQFAETLFAAGDYLGALATSVPIQASRVTYRTTRAAKLRKRAIVSLELSPAAEIALTKMLNDGVDSVADLAWTLGTISEQRGEKKRAAQMFRRVAELEPNSERGQTAARKAKLLVPDRK